MTGCNHLELENLEKQQKKIEKKLENYLKEKNKKNEN